MYDIKYNSRIRIVKDWPKMGVDFLDLMPVYSDPQSLQEIRIKLLNEALKLTQTYNNSDVLYVGLEARGYPLAGMLAAELQSGLLLVRKAGKSPPPTIQVSAEKEYGSDIIELPAHKYTGKKAVIIDDVIATGGTIRATASLLYRLECDVIGAITIAQIPNFNPTFDFPVHNIYPNWHIL